MKLKRKLRGGFFYQQLEKYKSNLTILMLGVNLHQSFFQLFLREEENIILNLLKKHMIHGQMQRFIGLF